MRTTNKIPGKSLLFVHTPTELVSPLVSPSVRFSFDQVDWKVHPSQQQLYNNNSSMKSSLKKPGIQPFSTPSKNKRVRFNQTASQVFYPVAQFYNEGLLISPGNKITRRGLL